jgi:hypothetical protein
MADEEDHKKRSSAVNASPEDPSDELRPVRPVVKGARQRTREQLAQELAEFRRNLRRAPRREED